MSLFINIKSIKKFFTYKFNIISLNIISLMLGFFIASVLSTIPAQTGDWGIMSAGIIVTINEILSKFIYYYKKRKEKAFCIKLVNNVKLGIIYGLFVDAFKLGS
uniref:Uncharacterized protein ycf20 n=1 Tax=Thuretia quercifolia TaxID=189650 RepID=A0A1Z1MKL2_9FLOR|nr:hypothetical protein [Thuretia quercifolia]ARW66382.1 hypothetical protein [Thuretia quercifolia]